MQQFRKLNILYGLLLLTNVSLCQKEVKIIIEKDIVFFGEEINQKIINSRDKGKVIVCFSERFKNDTLSVFLNKKLKFRGVLNTDDRGYTQLSFNLKKRKKLNYLIIKNSKDKIEVNQNLNNDYYYILIGKDDENGWMITYSNNILVNM